jgi:hypothetical protein
MSSRWPGTEGAIGERWLGRWMVGMVVVYPSGFVVLHPAIIGTGYLAYRNATTVSETTGDRGCSR